MKLKITKRISYFLFLSLLLSFACVHSPDSNEGIPDVDEPETLIMRRDDGSISSVNQVDENNKVHGIRATYYGDGKTLYSKLTFSHGRKQGPATWYYMDSKVYKQSHFEEGKRQGLTRVYYKNGKLSAEYESHKGNVLPGLKEYKEDGTLITDYPDIQFREIDLLASKSRVDLEIFCTKKRSGVKFYMLDEMNGEKSRVYLITENDSTVRRFNVQPGQTLHKKLNILAVIPTALGNLLAREYTYQLNISN